MMGQAVRQAIVVAVISSECATAPGQAFSPALSESPLVEVDETLSLRIDERTLETWIGNTTAMPLLCDAYQITSPSGILDPVNWRSIEEATALDPAGVTAVLGQGALSFVAAPTSNAHSLSEFNILAEATWQAGARWSIGFPFGTSPAEFHSRPLDAEFKYVVPTGVVVTGSIAMVPEPTAAVLWATALLGVGLVRRRLC